MQHKVKVTVIDKKLFPELQAEYCSDPNSGMCPCYNIGDEFIFERYGINDDFWHMGLNTLKQTSNVAGKVAGGTEFPHCSEAWDAISRYIYAGLQGGSIMRGWMSDERVMIACCSDGTRPVIFKIERLDYKALFIEGIDQEATRNEVEKILKQINGVKEVVFKEQYVEVYIHENIPDDIIKEAVEKYGNYSVIKIE